MSYNETFDIAIALRAFLILGLPNLNITFILGQMIIWKGGKASNTCFFTPRNKQTASADLTPNPQSIKSLSCNRLSRILDSVFKVFLQAVYIYSCAS